MIACHAMAKAMQKDTKAITNTTIANAGKYMASSVGVMSKNHEHSPNTVEHPMNNMSLVSGFML